MLASSTFLRMNIIIVGCGKVGQALAEQLGTEDHNITVVDISPAKVTETTDRYDCMGVVGNGATLSALKDAGIENADLLIAVTGSDERNLLCCLIAKKAGNCHTIARVRSPQYSVEASYLQEELGLAMVINPEQAAAAEIARVLQFPSAMKIDTFAKGKVELLKFRLPENSPLVGCSVKEITTKLHCDVLVCTIERDDDAYIANGDFMFMEKDVISIIAAPKNAYAFFKKINYKATPVKDVMIVGGGDIAHYLCDMLDRAGIPVKIIEKSAERCEELSQTLQSASVINGDAADKDVLLQEGISTTGAFVALTNLDEENILLSLFARSMTNGKLVTKVNRIDFETVIKHLDLDSIIYPKNITSDSIVRYVRAMSNTIGCNVETLTQMIKGKVEAAEFVLREDEPEIIGIPLMNLKFKENVLVAAILRDKKVILPRGNDTIERGDAVVIVTTQLALNDITDILR